MVTIKEFKLTFFDRPAVLNATDKASRKVLSKFGAFVRTRARRSIRKAKQTPVGEMTEEQVKEYRKQVSIAKYYGRKKPKRPLQASKPGQPPRSVIGLLRQFILFGFDAAKNSVVVGPARLNGSAGPVALQALEYGGEFVNPKGKRITIKARPFMTPAFNAELPKLDSMWINSIK